MSKKPTLYLIAGYAGTGKSTLGRKLAKRLNCVLIDKDTASELFVDYIQEQGGFEKGRESEEYVWNIKPLEYRTMFKLAAQNLAIGNSVVAVAPAIDILQSHEYWKKYSRFWGVGEYELKVIWMKHDLIRERRNIFERNSPRDANKIKNWDAYAEGVKEWRIDPKFRFFEYDYMKEKAKSLVKRLG